MEEKNREPEQQEENQEPKKRFRSQNYYIIKMIAGGLIGYFGVRLLVNGYGTDGTEFWVSAVFGVLFLAFAAWTLFVNIREYIRYTKTYRYEDEIYGWNSEEAGLDPDAPVEEEKKEPTVHSISQAAHLKEEDPEEEKQEEENHE